MDSPIHKRTEWLRQSGWGVMCHYLGEVKFTVDEWNRRVDSFDVEAFAAQLADVGAGHLIFTVGQNSGFYASPNDAYDRFVGIRPSKCSRRDLVMDIGKALAKRNIRLIVYSSNGAPDADPVAVEKLQWKKGDLRLAEFQTMWETILREWSTRWGKLVSGWWLDGCYHVDAMYRQPEPPNQYTFADALKAGNPDAILAFNPGVKIARCLEVEDYTAGEMSDNFPIGFWTWNKGPWFVTPLEEEFQGRQLHILQYIGEWWGNGGPRFPDELLIGYAKLCLKYKTAVTWDVPIEPNGRIPDAFISQLAKLPRRSTI